MPSTNAIMVDFLSHGVTEAITKSMRCEGVSFIYSVFFL